MPEGEGRYRAKNPSEIYRNQNFPYTEGRWGYLGIDTNLYSSQNTQVLSYCRSTINPFMQKKSVTFNLKYTTWEKILRPSNVDTKFNRLYSFYCQRQEMGGEGKSEVQTSCEWKWSPLSNDNRKSKEMSWL